MKKIVVIGSLNMDVVIETKMSILFQEGKVRTKHMQLENLVEMLR